METGCISLFPTFAIVAVESFDSHWLLICPTSHVLLLLVGNYHEKWWTEFNVFSVKPCKQTFNLGDKLFLLCML